MLGGIDEALAILRALLGTPGATAPGRTAGSELEVRALYEGDEIEPWETVLTIEGDYALFAHLETPLPRLPGAAHARHAQRARRSCEAARGKPILYFPARHDHWHVQTGDGWAAHVAGAIGVSTDAQASWWGGKGMGTVPARADRGLRRRHGRGGARVRRRFARRDERDRARRLRERLGAAPRSRWPTRSGRELWGVRLDTSSTMVDRSLLARDGRASARAASRRSWSGRCATRSTTPATAHVQIVVSGGFDARKIERFEEAGVPVDAYGVGTSLMRGDERLHRRRRARRRPPARQGRPRGASQPAPGARDVRLGSRSATASWSSGR